MGDLQVSQFLCWPIKLLGQYLRLSLETGYVSIMKMRVGFRRRARWGVLACGMLMQDHEMASGVGGGMVLLGSSAIRFEFGATSVAKASVDRPLTGHGSVKKARQSRTLRRGGQLRCRRYVRGQLDQDLDNRRVAIEESIWAKEGVRLRSMRSVRSL